MNGRASESIACVMGRLRFDGSKLVRTPAAVVESESIAISTALFQAARRAHAVGLTREAYVRLAELAFDVVADSGHPNGG